MINRYRDFSCPSCGENVRIPIYWVLGLEAIFACDNCKQKFRINYKMGALLAGIGCALAIGTIQLLAFFTAAFTVSVALLALIPLAIFYCFILRRALLFIRVQRIKRQKKY